MKILVTGGTGYIGSHVVVELLNQNHDIEILDNLINSKITVLNQIQKITSQKPTFHEIDLLDKPKLNRLFQNTHFDLVMHFAGLKAVGESIEQPLEYYKNNVTGTLNLLECMQNHKVQNFIFSSSATVYGNPGVSEYTENTETGRGITNPYGRTKYMIEEILKDLAISNKDLSIISLRYFNPIGNHSSGLIGEDPNGIPNNLMPYVTKVAIGELPKLKIYGNDYDTPDGTCLRDYIHVVDLAKGHLAAIKGLKPGLRVYNLGTGHPTSVLEMVNTFGKINGKSLPYEFISRRPGDLPALWANPNLAKEELHWQTNLTVEDAIRDIITFIKHS